ncbi:MAG: hypothetical protein QOE36_3112 [Gaiellaceae bacterium]|nr:hypothetical protein [Gaiellaceae bacterium]
MLKRSALIATVTGIALAVATPAAPRSTNLDACSLISTGQLASILGLPHVEIVRNIPGGSGPTNSDGVTHSVCNGVAWSGTPPSTPSGIRSALASGTGAAFAIDTWAPDDASASVDRWKTKGFPRFVTTAGTAVVALGRMALPVAVKPSHPHLLLTVGGNTVDASAFGVTGTPRKHSGIRITEGTWWSGPAFAAVSIGFEESAAKHSVKQLNRLAKIGVAAFGLKPCTLG